MPNNPERAPSCYSVPRCDTRGLNLNNDMTCIYRDAGSFALQRTKYRDMGGLARLVGGDRSAPSLHMWCRGLLTMPVRPTRQISRTHIKILCMQRDSLEGPQWTEGEQCLLGRPRQPLPPSRSFGSAPHYTNYYLVSGHRR